jgi:RNA polymerase sigma-70 factor (ECF subfamily)
VPLPEADHTPAPSIDRDTAMVVRSALARLPIDQRAALVLVDLQGYPVADAARVLGVAEGTVKSRCARGRARLAIMLGHLRDTGHAAERNPEAGGDVPSRTGNASGATPVGKEGGT